MSDLHWTESTRNGLTLIREIAVIGAIGIFFFAPSVIGASMSNAGLEKLSVPGFGELVARTEEIREEAREAQVQVALAQDAVEDARQELRQIARRNPAVRGDVSAASQQIIQSSQVLKQSNRKISDAVVKQDQLVSEIRNIERQKP